MCCLVFKILKGGEKCGS
ncbi:MAG: (2Fe-2S)-binding protein [Holosporales bacterium]|nr:(2Fe-2S)-binding protein [Holosporales bacterium]